MMFDPDGFARRLDLALRARRVGKMHALAVALGIDESALSRWRRGRSISLGNLIRLCHHLRVSIDWVLTGSGRMDIGGLEADPPECRDIIADLAALDPGSRERLADLVRHLAGARRSGSFDPAAWTATGSGEPERPSIRRRIDG